MNECHQKQRKMATANAANPAKSNYLVREQKLPSNTTKKQEYSKWQQIYLKYVHYTLTTYYYMTQHIHLTDGFPFSSTLKC